MNSEPKLESDQGSSVIICTSEINDSCIGIPLIQNKQEIEFNNSRPMF